MTKRLEIIGHKNKRNALERLYLADKLPHSFIFAGPSGIGKKQVAFELYRSYFCENKSNKKYSGCGNCKSCQLFLVNSLPYLHIINCEDKENINVDSLRTLLHELHLKVESTAKRVVILDNAEYLTIQAQNILLKTLEEPRPDTFFCLITTNPNKLLQTIQSRCQVWFFDSLTSQEILQILDKIELDKSITKDDLNTLSALTDGSLDNLQKIINCKDQFEEAKSLIKLVSKKQLAEASVKIQELKNDKEALKIQLNLLRILARQAMLQSSDTKKSFAWSVFLTNIIQAEYYIFERNLNAELVLQNVFLSLLSPSRNLSFQAVGNDARILSNLTT
jgi:DNA polymerase III gamma/tau subunit